MPAELISGNDLQNDEVWLEITEQIKSGLVQGVHMGPPCSTCSHARYNPPALPRPIRSKTHPLGLARGDLSTAEKREVEAANYLYLQCLAVGELCWENFIPFAIEFPSQLSDDHVTLADLPSAVALLSREGVRKVDLDQCRFDSHTMKPTSLICWGAGWESTSLKCNHPWVHTGRWTKTGEPITKPPHASALTLNYNNKVEGKWKTKSLSAYPPKLCSCIARAIVTSHFATVRDKTSLGNQVPDLAPPAAASFGSWVPDLGPSSSHTSGPEVPDPGLHPTRPNAK